jgi:coproporphyrinogen III oxidase-like Fe-S oxidoreductase
MLEKGAFPIDFEEELAYPQNLYELFAVQLRLKQGVDLSLFQRMHGSLPNAFFHCLERLEERGWVKRSGEVCALTDAGMLFYDSVAVEMI